MTHNQEIYIADHIVIIKSYPDPPLRCHLPFHPSLYLLRRAKRNLPEADKSLYCHAATFIPAPPPSFPPARE